MFKHFPRYYILGSLKYSQIFQLVLKWVFDGYVEEAELGG
jgi:hypothetical protein